MAGITNREMVGRINDTLGAKFNPAIYNEDGGFNYKPFQVASSRRGAKETAASITNLFEAFGLADDRRVNNREYMVFGWINDWRYEIHFVDLAARELTLIALNILHTDMTLDSVLEDDALY